MKNKILELLRQYDTPTVCNAIESFHLGKNTEGYMFAGMERRTGGEEPLVGYAVTARVSAENPDPEALEKLMKYYGEVREAKGPVISVIQDMDVVRKGAFYGEVQSTVHKALGCIGAIVDGGVRDLKEVDQLGFSTFSTEVLVAHGYTHVVASSLPVTILGLTVYPGDLLHADRHGVVKIPKEILGELPKALEKIVDAELPLLEPCREAIARGIKPSVEDLRNWRVQMEVKRKG